MAGNDDEEKLLRSAALQTSTAILTAQQRAQQELLEAKQTLERRGEQLARSLAMMRATLESTTDGVLVTDAARCVTDFNERYLKMWQLPRELIQDSDHGRIIEVGGALLRDLKQFRARLDEIYRDAPPETYDVLELADGRVFERFSRLQLIDDRQVGRVWSFRDITERVRAERELRDQTEWFSVTLGSIGDAVITVDNEQLVTFLNPVAETLTGWKSSEALGRPIREVLIVVSELTREPATNPIDAALESGQVVGLGNHTLLLRRDGSELPIEDSAAPIKNPQGEIIGAVMVFHDVSDRREREMALAESEVRYRLMGQVVPQLLWTADKNGQFEFGNDRWHTYTGQTPEQSRGSGWLDVVHPDDLPRTLTTWEKAIATAEPFELERRLRGANGEYRWYVTRGVPFRDASGRVIRWYGSSTDFHQLKQTADALREEYTITEQLNEVSRALATELELPKVVQIITDAGTRITRAQFGAFFYNVVDENGEALMLYTLSGVPKEKFDKFPNPRATSLFGPTFRGEGIIRADDIRQDPRFGKNPPYHGMPAGHLPVVSYLAVPVFSRSGEVLGGLFFGHSEPGVFTERDEKILLGVAAQAGAAMDTAQLYQNAQQARAAAEHASQAKDMFLAALSHELRTPLTPALAVLSSLRDDEDVPADLRPQLEMVERNVELEARLIDDLLDLTRITRGKLELHRQRIDLVRMIDCAIDTCMGELQRKTLQVVRELQQPEWPLIGDSARITQILWNLLKNAIKFTPDGGTITIRSHSVRAESAVPVKWVVEVEDTGIGIDPEQIERVFDAFEQGDRRITRQFGGLGLGLAISKAIAESHGGTLVASSPGPGKGSTFTLTLPVELPGSDLPFPPAEAEAAQATPHASIGPVAPKRILLVEDHADTAAILSKLLRRMGHHIMQASNVQRAKAMAEQAVKEGGLDLVISDLGLPDGSGLDLMRELSSKYDVRGIALSGYGMDSDMDQSKAAGFSRHLIKPLAISDVRAAIEDVLRSPDAR